MPTNLFLIRHGETLSNIELIYQGQTGDSDLSELGVKEGQELARGLKNQKFDAIYSSTLKRSIRTAGFIADGHGLQVAQVPELKERYYGVFEGLRFEVIKQKYPELYETWLTHPDKAIIPKAETLEQLQKRGVEAVEKLLAKHTGGNICVVGHGAINRTILFHYMNLTLDNFWRIKQDNCCVNLIEIDKHPIVILLNSTWFLGEKRISRLSVY
ncbi:MAG: histidine phosphatase family protein [Candidatus Margulisiibacteriota bacterium]